MSVLTYYDPKKSSWHCSHLILNTVTHCFPTNRLLNEIHGWLYFLLLIGAIPFPLPRTRQKLRTRFKELLAWLYMLNKQYQQGSGVISKKSEDLGTCIQILRSEDGITLSNLLRIHDSVIELLLAQCWMQWNIIIMHSNCLLLQYVETSLCSIMVIYRC